MIFVTVGSQKFQFNRLLTKLDELVECGIITDRIFAQIGVCDYKPKHYEFKDFLDRDEFKEKTAECDIFVTHGGTGAIIGAVKSGKKVIALARLKEFGEHVDDHQIQLLKQFDELNLITACYNTDEFEKAFETIESRKFNSYESNTKTIIDDIESWILEEVNKKKKTK